jgi:hypothetical protein
MFGSNQFPLNPIPNPIRPGMGPAAACLMPTLSNFHVP